MNEECRLRSAGSLIDLIIATASPHIPVKTVVGSLQSRGRPAVVSRIDNQLASLVSAVHCSYLTIGTHHCIPSRYCLVHHITASCLWRTSPSLATRFRHPYPALSPAGTLSVTRCNSPDPSASLIARLVSTISSTGTQTYTTAYHGSATASPTMQVQDRQDTWRRVLLGGERVCPH